MSHRHPTLLQNVAYALAQLGPGKLRAHLDLFIGRFNRKVEWSSGLGDGIHVLYGLVRALKPAAIIEIGSAKGKSTCAMALACSQNQKGKVYAIDPHTANYWSDRGSEKNSYDFLVDRLRSYGLTDWCEVIRKTSRDALAIPPVEQVDLVFIDGDHSYEGVKLDFELCRPLLSKNALVMFHDSAWEYFKDHADYREGLGVLKFLEELRQADYEAVTIAAWPGLTILQAARGGFAYHPRKGDAQ